MTFSIAARCEETGALGAVISTSSIAVTSRCVWVAPGTGVVLSQNVTDPRLGQLGLRLLGLGHGASATLTQLVQARAHAPWRQLAVLDADGVGDCYSGAHALGVHAGVVGRNCVAIGNLLARDSVPTRMVEAFESSAGQPLAPRLLAALRAGLEDGGENGDEHSAGLVVYGRESWPLADLRVDWDEAPIARLQALWERYEPQMADYVQRAKNPDQAPAFQEA